MSAFIIAGLVLVGTTPAPAPAEPVPGRPLGNPGDWVSVSDYPASALRNSEQGVVEFRAAYAIDGSVSECKVTQSSGSVTLDQATCALISARARFQPGKDSAGNPVTGTYA